MANWQWDGADNRFSKVKHVGGAAATQPGEFTCKLTSAWELKPVGRSEFQWKTLNPNSRQQPNPWLKTTPSLVQYSTVRRVGLAGVPPSSWICLPDCLWALK